MSQLDLIDGIDRPSNQNGPRQLGRAWTRCCTLALLLGAAACPGETVSEDSVLEVGEGIQLTLPDGEIRGNAERGTRSFIGIPYAAAPTGALRWKPPQSPERWSGVLDATGPGVSCFQSPSDTDANTSDVAQTEDCLRLNVFAPERPHELVPVLVWLHGGDNGRGSANDIQPATGKRLYDGASLRWYAQEEVVVVTVNYRLGALGFLTHDALTREAGSSGNYGLMDQQAALRWVQRSVRAFGGDPDRVTLVGQGAGASDACHQLVARGGAGLVHAAVLESGTCGTSALADLTSGQARGAAVASELGCDDSDQAEQLACLRALPAEQLASAEAFAVRSPAFDDLAIVDGVWLREQPSAAIETGRFEQVPVIVGTNIDEGSYFVRRKSEPIADKAAYRAWLGELFGVDRVSAIEDRYPAIEAKDVPYGLGYAYPDVLDLIVTRVVTDAFFTCPAQRLSDTLSRFADVYRYEFVRKPELEPFADLGATHGAELLWVWNVWPYVSPYATGDTGLSVQIGGYWSRLVNGDPNREGEPNWPRYDATTRQSLVFDLTVTSAAGRDPYRCGFWNASSSATPRNAEPMAGAASVRARSKPEVKVTRLAKTCELRRRMDKSPGGSHPSFKPSDLETAICLL